MTASNMFLLLLGCFTFAFGIKGIFVHDPLYWCFFGAGLFMIITTILSILGFG